MYCSVFCATATIYSAKTSSNRSTDTSFFSSSSSEDSQRRSGLDELVRAQAARNTRRTSFDALFKPLAAIRQRLQKPQQLVTPIEQMASGERRVSSPSVTNKLSSPSVTNKDFSYCSATAETPETNKAGDKERNACDRSVERRQSCYRTPRWPAIKRHRIRETRHRISFEFKAFEVVVVNAFDEICTDIQAMEHDLSRFGSDNTQSRTLTVDLELLHHLKAPIEIYRNRVKQMDKAFDELLKDPEDMKRMELWRYRKNPKLYEVQRMVFRFLIAHINDLWIDRDVTCPNV